MAKPNNKLRQIVFASMFGALTAIGAFITIPMQPVPFTLQTMFTGLSGVLLGGYTGALSQVVYILLGVIGLPVFASGKSGLGTLLGPTGGYLIGFVVGAYVIGRITESRKRQGLAWTIFALLIGQLVIYTFGIIQLSIVADISLSKAFLVGVVPFLLGDAIKILAAALIANYFRKKLNFKKGF